jgi:UDP-N-acetylglucosamine 1-carboxyvinyltransferase
MRASILVLGPLLARIGKATVALPGGCAIGARPIDLHLKGLEAMGAKVQTFEKDGFDFVEATAEHLKGCEIYLDFPSVGATQNLIMAAVLAEGTTLIQNAAEEPEIVDLANFLNKMGAKVKGAGTDNIRIEGVKALHGTEHTVIPDRIETGTFMVAAAISGGDLTIHNAVASHLTPITAKLRETGVDVFEGEDFIRVDARGKSLKAVNIKTLPYPGFPTDMQAQFMALLAVAKGKGTINETVFENRFMHIDQLRKMGADITYADRKASIIGTKALHGAQVRATDLRAGAALVLAGLVAEGVTEVSQVYYIERGYEEFVEKMRSVGADIEYIEE